MSEIYKTKTKQERAMKYSLINLSVIFSKIGVISRKSAGEQADRGLTLLEVFPAGYQCDTDYSIPGYGDVLRRGMNGMLLESIVELRALTGRTKGVWNSVLSMGCSFPNVNHYELYLSSKQTW